MRGELGGWRSPEGWNPNEGPAGPEEIVSNPGDIYELPVDIEPRHDDEDPGEIYKGPAESRRPADAPRDFDIGPVMDLLRFSVISAEPEQHSNLAEREASEFVTSTVEAFADFLIQRIADAHGATLIYNAVKLLYGAYKWEQVGEDGGGVDFQAPLPLGNNAILGVIFHLGGDPDTPPIKFGLAPNGESGAGAVAVGKLEMDPAPDRADVPSSRSQLPEKRFGPVQIVPLRLPPGLRNGLEPADAAAAARDAAEEGLLPQLLPERQRLRDAGVELVLGCDSDLGLAQWVHLGDTSRSEQIATSVA